MLHWTSNVQICSADILNRSIIHIYWRRCYRCYRHCPTSFKWAWTQVLHRFKPCWQHVGDSWMWGSLTMVPVGNKAKDLSLVNHSTNTIHYFNHHHHHHDLVCLCLNPAKISMSNQRCFNNIETTLIQLWK